jgi:hypothetical protein
VGLFYLDVEAEGEDPRQDRLITIQFRPLSDDLHPLGNLTVLAEWEWGEKEMLRIPLGKGVLDPSWDFVPVGNRVRFDLTFLIERAQHHKLREWGPAELRRFWFEKPMLDLGNVLILMNGGKFDGSSIENFADKGPSSEVPALYRQGKYEQVLEYIHQEADATLALLAEMRSLLTAFGERKRKR